MRIALNIVASLVVLAGVIWFLQGINVLPGSFMTGQIRWAVYGGIAFAVGIALLLLANHREKRVDDKNNSKLPTASLAQPTARYASPLQAG